MDAQEFLKDFSLIANAPGGIARLRELVLQLAISGRLVAPSQGKQSVAEELATAAALRAAYENELGIRATRALPPVDVAPFAIPRHWQWVRLEQLSLYVQRGKGPTYANTGGIRVVSQKCVQWHGFDSTEARYVADESMHVYGEERFLRDGDLLWNSTGTGTAGRVAIYRSEVAGRAVTDSHVTVIRPANSLSSYLWCVIASPWTQARISPDHPDSLVSGTTQQVELATSTARGLPVPCPPIEEQARIVAKVDELMAACETMERHQSQLRILEGNLRQSSLHAVAAAASRHELQLSWTRFTDNFAGLLQAKEDVYALRDTVLDLAMRGLLLPTAAIRESSSEDGLPAVATGWKWETLGKLSEYITSGSRGWKRYLSTSGDVFIRSQDIKHDALVFENPAFVTLPERAEGQRTLVREGDLLLTITGGNVGKCARVPSLTQRAYVSQHVALIRLDDRGLAEFIHFWIINALGGRAFLSRYIYGDKPGLNLTQVGSIPIPVPPESARAHVFAALRKLSAMCNVLAQQIDSERHLAEVFAAAAVASITGSNIDQQESRAVKAPQTELIAVVRLGQVPGARNQAPLATILAHQNGELAASNLWQRFGGGIDEFYAQLKREVARGWIQEPAPAEMREVPSEQETA